MRSKSGCATTRERVGGTGTARDTSWNSKNEKFDQKLCVVAKDGYRPGGQGVSLC